MARPTPARFASNDNASEAANDNADFNSEPSDGFRSSHDGLGRAELDLPPPDLGAIPQQTTTDSRTESQMIVVSKEIALQEDDDSSGWRGLALLLLVSVGVHFAVFGGLDRVRGREQGKARRRPPAQVTVDVAPPKPAPPPPAEAPKPAPKEAARRVAVRAPAPKSATPPPPPPEAETPADFSGTTLTNDGAGPGWASAVGNGEAMHGPIGRPGAKVTARAQEGAAGPPPPKPQPVVALASLSRPPEPPDLNDALESHYPEQARKQGTPGQAVLKARITAEGHIRDMVVVSQTAPWFGDACRATLRDSIWTPPLDRDGQPVATYVSYTCRFEVR